MRVPLYFYLIIFASGFLLLAQYKLTNPWVIYPQNNGQYIGEMDNAIEKRFINSITSNNINSCVNYGLESIPPLYIITPTYSRPEQLAELTRLSHTLMLVPNLIWLVIEDAYKTNKIIEDLLKKSGINYYYFVAPMPEQYKKRKGAKPRGVSNRNKGIDWIRENAKSGVFYFADDDNTYDLELFNEIRYTKNVSMFPVGLITQYGVSTPIVKNGVFSGFYDGWIGGRKFAVDMAGFAISVNFLFERPKATMPFKPGFEEDGFLKSLAPFEPHQIELLASNCTKILVWHTQAKKNKPSTPLKEEYNNTNTNLFLLKQILI